MIGFDNYYQFGAYLHGRISTFGMQIKIDKINAAQETEFFKQLEEHFQLQWAMAYKNVIFSIDGYKIEYKIIDTEDRNPD